MIHSRLAWVQEANSVIREAAIAIQVADRIIRGMAFVIQGADLTIGDWVWAGMKEGGRWFLLGTE
jgi:hypothetical protein